ncbi:MAG: recombination protein [Siphoviridae sp. ctvD11]|nr:MAG: recombination protein [Siphoviridae sp. ctvD11]
MKRTVRSVKRNIQHLLRMLVLLKYNGCLAKKYGHCFGPWNAAHIMPRRHARTYALSINVVQMCEYHNNVWQDQNKDAFKALVIDLIGEDMYRELEAMSKEETHYTIDDWIDFEDELKAEIELC